MSHLGFPVGVSGQYPERIRSNHRHANKPAQKERTLMTIRSAIIAIIQDTAPDLKIAEGSVPPVPQTPKALVHELAGSRLTVDIVDHNAVTSCDTCRTITDTLMDRRIDVQDARIHSANIAYAYGEVLRTNDGFPYGYRMHFDAEVIPAISQQPVDQAA